MHRRPRLNSYGRRLLVERLEQNWTAASAAEAAEVSRATVDKWWRRYQAEGWEGLADRSSRPHSSPRRLPPEREAAVLELRQSRRLGPHRLAALTGVPASTCYQALRRHQLHRLDWLDRPTGRLIRRYEASQPGELGQMDVKKLARIPEGGWHFVHGRQSRPRGEMVTRCEPPVRLAWREISERSMQQREGNYILVREGDGTRMTLDITYNSIELRGRLMSPLLSVIGPRLARRLLNQLKQGVEGQRRP